MSLISALKERFENIMMPAFSSTFITRPPNDDHPFQNGCDYGDKNFWQLNSTEAFHANKMVVNSGMGIVSQIFSAMPYTCRSEHPWHSWSVFGSNAQDWTKSHHWDKPHAPLEKLLDSDGWIILMGVDLRSCSAIHVAEEKAGRKPFIRWARNHAGQIARIKVSGCSKGFHCLEKHLFRIVKKIKVGGSLWYIINSERLMDETIALLQKHPEITRCSHACLRCNDTILGGVIEEVTHEGY